MLSRYDTEQAARVDCEFARKYDTSEQARVDCECVRAYDSGQKAWVDKLKKLMEVFVGSGFYNMSGNLIFCTEGTFHCEVKPTSTDYAIEFVLKDNFTNPVITCEYSFGYSDLCPNIYDGYRSHACVGWVVTGYSDGVATSSKTIAYGNGYAYNTVFNVPYEVTLEGKFDEMRLVCLVTSFSNYSDFGKANTSIHNFTVDGKKYSAKTQSITS